MARPHLEKVSVIGTALAVLGCLGFPAVIAVLSTLGARWLLKVQYLLPLLLVLLGLGLGHLYRAYHLHRRPFPLALAGMGGAAILATEVYRGLTHHHLYILGYPGLALFIAAFILNARFQQGCLPLSERRSLNKGFDVQNVQQACYNQKEGTK